MGEIFSVDVSIDEDDSSCGSNDITIEERDPNETLIRKSSVDVVFTVLVRSMILIRLLLGGLITMTMCPLISSTFFILLLYAHYPPTLLSVKIGHLLILILFLRRIRSNILRLFY